MRKKSKKEIVFDAAALLADPDGPGRRWEEFLKQIKFFISIGLSRWEACKLVGLKLSRLADYEKSTPSFTRFVNNYKDIADTRSKLNLVNAISNGDVPVSQWWLERRCRSEFGRQDAGNTNVQVNVVRDWSDEERQKMLTESQSKRDSSNNTLTIGSQRTDNKG